MKRLLLSLPLVILFAFSAAAQFFTPVVTLVTGAGSFNNLQTFSGTPAPSGLGSNTRTLITKIQPGAFGTSSGGSIRVTLKQNTVAASTAVILAVTVCPSSGVPNAWSCSVAPTQLTFAGGFPLTIAAGGSITSNSVTHTLAGSTPLLVAIDTDTASDNSMSYIPITYALNVTTNTNPTATTTGCGGGKCFVAYQKGGINQAITSATARSGSYGNVNDTSIFVSKIEVQ